MPPDGAGPLRVTVPVATVPPATAFGVKLTPTNAVGFTVIGTVKLAPKYLAVICATVVVGTLEAEIWKVPLEASWATEIEAGTLT
jgi:hypothetical protein